MFWGVVADGFCYVCNGHGCVCQEILGAFDADRPDDFCVGHSHEAFDQAGGVFV